jgi:DNA-directed RNA polymerase subunit RPC12/RpoP
MMNQQPYIDLKDTRDVACECGNVIFMPALRVRKASRLVTGGDKDTVIPIDIFLCTNCGKPLQDLLPPELQESKIVK